MASKATKTSKDKVRAHARGQAADTARHSRSHDRYTCILALQRTVGNQAVNALMDSNTGRESAPVHDAPAGIQSVLNGGGHPLDPATRVEMESRFGHDFSGVRVHTGAKAAESARAMNSDAYTLGTDIVFDAGQYSPGTGHGRRLVAHELAHVIQQNRGGSPGNHASPMLNRSLERDADNAATRYASGSGLVTVSEAATPGLSRQEKRPAVSGQMEVNTDAAIFIQGTRRSSLGKGATVTVVRTETDRVATWATVQVGNVQGKIDSKYLTPVQSLKPSVKSLFSIQRVMALLQAEEDPLPEFVRLGTPEVREPYLATWSLIHRYEQMGKNAVASAPTTSYRAWDPYYQAWNFAREDYRKMNLKGGAPILRNAEHYLFRKWLAHEGSAVTIPQGLPIRLPDPRLNPILTMSQSVMQRIHDPIYNQFIRPQLESISNVSKASHDMYFFERQGYKDGERSRNENPSENEDLKRQHLDRLRAESHIRALRDK